MEPNKTKPIHLVEPPPPNHLKISLRTRSLAQHKSGHRHTIIVVVIVLPLPHLLVTVRDGRPQPEAERLPVHSVVAVVGARGRRRGGGGGNGRGHATGAAAALGGRAALVWVDEGRPSRALAAGTGVVGGGGLGLELGAPRGVDLVKCLVSCGSSESDMG